MTFTRHRFRCVVALRLVDDFQGNRTICIPIVDVPHGGGQFSMFKFRSILFKFAQSTNLGIVRKPGGLEFA